MVFQPYVSPVFGRLTERYGTVLIALVLLFGVLYRLYGLTGDIMYDPVVYAQDAYNILNGTFRLDSDSWYDHRLPVFVPVVLAYATMGVGTLSTHLWTLLLSFLQLAALVWLGWRWLGREVTILAALFLVLLPLDVIYAGVLSPDMVIGALLTFSAVFWIRAFEDRPCPSRLLLLLSGFLCGAATITRAYALLLVVFFAVHAIWKRTSVRHLLWWCLGIAALGVPLLALYTVTTGDPFQSLKAMSGFYGNPETSEGLRFLYYPKLIGSPTSMTGLFALVFSVAAIFALARPTEKRTVLLCWMAPILIYLQFGSMSVDSYVPVFKRIRFLTPFSVPAALLAASVILGEVPGILRKFRIPGRTDRVTGFLLIGLVLVLSANSFVIVKRFRDVHTAVTGNFKRAVHVLKSEEKLPVLFDHWRTAMRFSYYFDFDEGSHFYSGANETARMDRMRVPVDSRLGYLAWYGDPLDIPDAFIVLEDEILAQVAASKPDARDYSKYLAGAIPPYCYAPPPSWELLQRLGTFRVFRNHPEK